MSRPASDTTAADLHRIIAVKTHGASLPCPVPQKYEFDEGVCEPLQSALGYAGDPQPVVENVQVHAPGGRRAGGLSPLGGS